MELQELIERPYRMRVYPIIEEEEIEWAVEYPDLPGCVAGGDTVEEAIEMGEDAKRAWIEIAYKDGKNIPSPSKKDENDYSGKFTLRIPKSLHRGLTLEAEEQEISLNQYLLYLITKNHFNDKKEQKHNNSETFEYVETYKRKLTTDGTFKDWVENASNVKNINPLFEGGLPNVQRISR